MAGYSILETKDPNKQCQDGGYQQGGSDGARGAYRVKFDSPAIVEENP